MSSDLELEKLYSPSKWQKRFHTDEIMDKHVEILEEHNKIVRKSIPASVNISYGNGEREKYDIFGTDLPENSPFLIFIHGGYWTEPTLTHSLMNGLSLNLHKNNIKSIFLGYELCPKVTLNQLIDNIKIGINKCLEYALENKANVYLAGHSAGAHLVAILFQNFIPNLPENVKSLIKDCFLLGGIYDLVPLVDTENNKPLKLNKNEAKLLSPMHLELQLNNCRFFIVTGEHDSPKFIEESQNLHKKVEKLSPRSEYIFLKNVDHFDMIERFVEPEYELIKLIINTINEEK